MMWFSILVGSLVFLTLRIGRIEGDLAPILWKWLVRLIWLGSIGFFQALELQRYLEGLTYRPFFGFYAGLLFATAGWILANLFARIGQAKRPDPLGRPPHQ